MDDAESRIRAYQEAVDVLNQFTAQEAAKIGNSQASLGRMAERVARPSGMTSGLANYTYNRTLRPTIDTLAANLTATGYSQALQKQLSDAIMAAKNRYEDAKNAYTVASTAPKTSGDIYGEQVKKSTNVESTTPEGMTSKTFTYNDGNRNYTGIVYFNADGSIAGAETPDMSYNAIGAADFYASNNQYISGWAGEGITQTPPKVTAPSYAVSAPPTIAFVGGESWRLTSSEDGNKYYVSLDGQRTRTVDDVINALR